MTRATGRVVNHDPRNRDYEAPRRAVRPTSVLHKLGPVLDQGTINACVGYTGANLLNAAIAVEARRRYNKAKPDPRYSSYLTGKDALDLYARATRADPFKWVYPPTDDGSSGLGLGKALKALGVIERYSWTFDFGQTLAHAQRQPVALGLIWTDAMNDPNSKGVIQVGTDLQLKRAIERRFGHEVVLRGINWPRKQARLRNQWGEGWGLKGEAIISLDDLERLLINNRGDCMVPEVVAA